MAAEDIVTQIVELDTTSDPEDLDPNIIRQRGVFLTPDGFNAMKLQGQVLEMLMAAVEDFETRIAALEGVAEDFETRIAALEA